MLGLLRDLSQSLTLGLLCGLLQSLQTFTLGLWCGLPLRPFMRPFMLDLLSYGLPLRPFTLGFLPLMLLG